MSGIKQVERRHFRRALLVSFLFVIGIPMIIFGAIYGAKNHSALGWIVMALGILFVASGFVSIPIFWVEYAEKRRLGRMAVVISQSESMSIDVLSDTLGRTQEKTRRDLRVLLQKGWLPGYAFVDQEDRVKKTDLLEIGHAVCSFCGAHFDYKGTEAKCPYCGKWAR